MDDKERLMVVIKQLMEHNYGLLDRYDGWVGFAQDGRLAEILDLLSEARGYVAKANDALARTLASIERGGAPDVRS